MTDQPAQPSAAEMEKMGAVAQAGGAAAAQEETPEKAREAARTAMREEADRQKIEIPDEELDRIADRLGTTLTAMFEQRGAFDQPMERVQPPPAQQQAPPGPGDNPEPAPQAEPTPRAPQKRTPAHKFFGL